MLDALNCKKKELEAVIDNCNAKIAKFEVDRESAEKKLALVNEMIDEELSKQPPVEADTVETDKVETEESEKIILVRYGSSQN